METITVYYQCVMYRVTYEPETSDVIEVLKFLDSRHAVIVEFEELDERLQDKIERLIA
jgi:hypothetical protein